MQDQEGSPRGWRSSATIPTWVLLAISLAVLSGLVLLRQGNLAWDDADYLRRGLADARYARAGHAWSVLPRLLDRLLLEQPKPPWLVGWIGMSVLAAGRSRIDVLIVLGSVLPFLLLAFCTVMLARRRSGPMAGLLALALLLASPRALSFGGKVMVETFLGCWTLLALMMAGEAADRPSRRRGLALGAATGLALLTKLTAVLLLAGALIPFLCWTLWPGPERRPRVRGFLWAVVAALAVAGPWYFRNGQAAMNFASFSASYNLLAEGQARVLAPGDRLGQILGELPGWPLVVLLGFLGFGISLRRGSASTSSIRPSATAHAGVVRFRVLTLASTAAATTLLMFPRYFDSRFLLPLWPPLAVAAGEMLAPLVQGMTPAQGRVRPRHGRVRHGVVPRPGP